MLASRTLEELKAALKKKEKTEIDLMVLSTQHLKTIIKENTHLKQIPPSQRSEVISNQFCKSMQLHLCPNGEQFLTQSTEKPDFYILIEGSLKIRLKTRKESLVEPFEVFGYTQKLTQTHWTPSTVTATEDSSIVSIPRAQFSALMKEVVSINHNNRLLEFLIKSVPGVKQLGQAGKDKILTFFSRNFYKPGDLLIAEGTLCDFAFVIEEGECRLVSSKNPLKKGTPIYQGLVSQTTSQYNIGVATVGEWVGDDSLIRNLPIDFSVIASNSVTVLRISKADFVEGLSRDTQNALRESMESKLRWRRERKKKIALVITKEVAKTNENDVIKLRNTEKGFPIASKSTIRLITKRIKAQGGDSPESAKMRYSGNEVRPKSGFSITKSVLHRKGVRSLDVDEKKVKLYTAGTLGRYMMPVVSTGKSEEFKERTRTGRSTGFDVKKQVKEFSSYGQMVRFGRPASPNPVDVWARKNNVKLFS